MRERENFAGLSAFECQIVVLGSGAAGFNAADLLKRGGARDLLLVTEAVKAGTSRNTGSDKQTYYKLSLAGDDPDSVRALAEDLFKGRCVDGDIALCEASMSTPSFLRLSAMGVPFPRNRYGEFIGYKTDHDPHRRATSVGPYTSRMMTEMLEKSANEAGVEILDGFQAIRILSDGKKVKGLLLLERKTSRLMVLFCETLVLATGGPAGIYSMSVYPESQFGSTGLAFEAGASGKNLTEWQYGLASVKPRWNVSGSYMQVLPRFVSVDSEGKEYDFLSDYPYSRPEMLSRIFLKGYQWPFDVRKLESGSSIIDVLCYLELEKGRRVYLDYMENPDGRDIPWAELSDEAREYLEKAGATQERPIDRLHRLNEPAYTFYLDKGVDLEKERLEISLSAQHNNGGLAINSWWESDLAGLFPVGEVAASHGVYRPGGSALNAGQCGSARAVQWILAHRNNSSWRADTRGVKRQIEEMLDLYENALEGSIELEAAYSTAMKQMSLYGASLRNLHSMQEAYEDVVERLENFSSVKAERATRLWYLFEYRNALMTQRVYLAAMIDYVRNGGASRGSAIYSDTEGRVQPRALDERFRYSLEDETTVSKIQEVRLEKGKEVFSYRDPRPIPKDDDFFENVWARYRKDGCIY
ncbi:MAG: FAD-binding protein [Spirochaetales bacterium]|nr:FAD-binding protein [Spirochaetales bacterium]